MEKYQIYIYRFFADGTLSNAKPCAECSRWLEIVSCIGVKYDIYYTNEESCLVRYRSNKDFCNQYQPYTTYF